MCKRLADGKTIINPPKVCCSSAVNVTLGASSSTSTSSTSSSSTYGRGRLGTAGTNKNGGIKPNMMGYHWILFWVSPTNINIYHHDVIYNDIYICVCFHKNGGTIIFKLTCSRFPNSERIFSPLLPVNGNRKQKGHQVTSMLMVDEHPPHIWIKFTTSRRNKVILG